MERINYCYNMADSGNNMENIQRMAERLTHIEGEVGKIGNEVKAIGGNVDKITVALLGNEFNKSGLVTTVTEQQLKIETLEEELRRIDEKHERRFDRIKYWLIGLSIGAGFGITKLIDLLQSINL